MRKILILHLLIAAGLCAGAQNDPALSGFVDSLLKPFKGKNSTGLAITVLYNGKPVVKKASGMASIELQVPFTHQSVVRIGYSEAREFISIAAVLMEKDGIFSLHDRVRKFYPGLPAWSEPVTILDLLNHRSGFVDEWSTALLMHGAMSNRFDKEQFFRLLYDQTEPEIEPGKGYMYCNSDFGLLRLIMEKATGKNLSDWIKQRIFDPLKMNDTRMQKNADDIVPHRAHKYNNGPRLERVQKTSPGGDYFILTNANDLAKWAIALNDPGSEVHAGYKKLLANVRMIPGKKNHYVTGHSIDTMNNTEVIIHEGVNGENYLSRIPAKGYIIVTLGNLSEDNYPDQNRFLCEYLLKKKESPFVKPRFAKKPVQVSETDLQQYVGSYRWLNQVSWQSLNEMRKLSEVFMEKGKLKMRYNGTYIIELIPVGKDIFYHAEEDFGVEIRFVPPSGNQPMNVYVSFDDGFEGVAMEKEVATWRPATAELKKFTGKYYSRHLDYYWTLVLNEKNEMLLRRPTVSDVVLKPDGLNQFYYVGEKYPASGFDQWILFRFDDKGYITGFTVWSGRVMHHRFDKIN